LIGILSQENSETVPKENIKNKRDRASAVKPRGSERVGGMALLLEVESQISNLSLIWVDAGYTLAQV
jgi:hypothetical protein